LSDFLAVEQRRLALAASLTRQAATAPRLEEVSHPGTRFEPAYPGVLVREDEKRRVFACTAYRAEEELGTVFTTLIAGRKPAVSVAPPGTPYH
jgi:hypothetical protein